MMEIHRVAPPPSPASTRSSSDKSSSSDAPVIRGWRHPAMLRDPTAVKPSALIAEVAGGTAAECAAVVCCPCGIIGLVLYAVVKIPAGICRRVIVRRRKRRVAATRKKSAAIGGSTMGPRACDDVDEWLGGGRMKRQDTWVFMTASAPLPEIVETEKEKEMWASFDGTGFWRSTSQREER